MFKDLSARVKLDEEDVARLQKERDKLLQKDTMASERAGELLAELEIERDLKLKAEERSAALQQRADRDTETITRLREERDELCQTEERLRSEHGAAREDCDRAIREHDEACGVADSLQADLGVAVNRRLDVESVVARLEKELSEVRGILQLESDEHDLLQAAVGVVTDALRVAQPEGSSSLAARVAGITARVGQLEEDAFHAGITQAFAVACSHYDREINLEVMSHGFTPVYDDDELDKMEKVVTPLVRNLADKLK
ncbi:uncharacterized protein [Miscanthus floridulus]|uniref:uncharacterized protein n=1 Tax=Miscanthus floridulus TaxID=154761 RepID=UPI003459B143